LCRGSEVIDDLSGRSLDPTKPGGEIYLGIGAEIWVNQFILFNYCLISSNISCLFHFSFSPSFPDLHARICKTYIEAVNQKASLSTIYGGIIGLGSLGINVIKTILLSQLSAIHETLEMKIQEIESLKKAISTDPSSFQANTPTPTTTASKKRKSDTLIKQQEYLQECEMGLNQCRETLKVVLGQYITASMQLPALPFRPTDRSAFRPVR
jgi:hypothetical protein